MSFTPAPVSPAISAEASIPAPRLLKRSYLAALCFFLILLVCGAGSVSLAQTAYFSGAQTILGSGFSDPAAVAVDSRGNVYVADTLSNAVKEILAVNGSIPASPTILTLGSGFVDPEGVAVDANGDVFVSDTGNGEFKEILAVNGSIPSSPTINILATTTDPGGIAVDSLGNAYVVASNPNRYIGTPLGNASSTLTRSSTLSAVSNASSAIPSLSEGSVYEILAVSGSIPTSPAIQLLSSGIPENSPYSYPNCVAVDSSGNVYVTDSTNSITSQGINSVYEILAVNGSIPASPTINVLASSFLNPVGLAVDGSGNVYVADSGNNAVKEVLAVNGSIPASPTVRTFGNDFDLPLGVAIDGSGNVYVADTGNNRVVVGSMSAVNFLTVNTGKKSPALALTFTFESSGTLGSTAVLTQGATGLDFANSGTGTCVPGTAYVAGATCTIDVTFTPKFAGIRYGAATLLNNAGSVIATGLLQGTGNGPQVAFLPGTQFAYSTGGTGPVGAAVDGNGDIYFSLAGSGVVFEVAAVNGVVPPSPTFKMVASGFGNSLWMTIDGSGDLYIADTQNSVVKEILAVNGAIPVSPTIRTLGSGFSNPAGVAVDGNGNVYVSGLIDGTVKEMLAVNGSIPASPTIKVLASGFSEPRGIAVDGSGNVFVSVAGSSQVKELLAVNGSIPASPTIDPVGSGFSSPAGIALDGNGNVYVADSGNNAVKEILAASGYGTVETLGSGMSDPSTVVVAGSGNLYIGDYGNDRIVELDVADPPSLTFASTAVGSTSPDSPQTLTVENVGNATLTFPTPSVGNNPGSPLNFPLSESGASPCPIVSAGSSEPGSLAAGASCQLFISFAPVTEGLLIGSLVLTDNNLNAAAPTYTSQSIGLSGTGTFSLTASPSSLTVAQGGSNTITITVAGISGNVTLASSLHIGMTAAFSPNPTTGTSVLTLSANNSVAPGIYSLSISATSGTLTVSTPILITVVPGPSFTLSASPPSVSVVQGISAKSTIAVIGMNGFTGSVNLAASGLPSSVTATLSPNPTTGAALLTLTAATNAPPGTQNITITGRSGALTASTILSLTVSPPQVAAPPPVNFGAFNIGTASPATPLTFVFVNGGVLGSTAVVTQGAAGLDFTYAGTGTCAPNTVYSPGQSCSINVLFTPTLSGTRYGAATVEDIYGNVLANAYLEGTGLGPQVKFLPGTESTVGNASGGLVSPNTVAVDGSGNVYIADAGNNLIWEESPSAGSYTLNTISSTSLNQPTGVAVDGSGNVYIADTGNNRVLEETPSPYGGNEITIADSANNGIVSPIGLAVDGSGNVYFFSSGTLYEESPSAGSFIQTTISTSGIANPGGIAVDGSGNLYIVDSVNNQVFEEVLSAGSYTQITIPTNGLSSPTGIALDGNSNIYIADTANNRVLEEKSSGGSYSQSTVSTSPLNGPLGVALDGSGNIYIADNLNIRVLKEDLADTPSLTFMSTAVGATSADSPQTVTVENAGNAVLSFPIPSTGNSPVIATNFTLDSSGASACPLISAGSSTAGTLAAGTSCFLPISFVPTAAGALAGSLVLTDNNLNAAAPGYTSQSISLSGTATQGTPTINWPMPTAITYGTALSATQLNATSTLAGTFTYSPAADTVLGAGQHTLTATFTPADTTDYTTATATVILMVNQATPQITWATPTAITYGTALSATQLNAASTIAGTFTYSPAAGTVLNAGTQTLTVSFTPTDLADYATANASVGLIVNKAAPTISWTAPAAISYGTGLSGTQLDATSTAAGTFAYSPAAGTVLSVGRHTLNVTFTPTNTTDYSAATASVTLTVNKATPTITWATPAAIAYGTALSATQLDATSTVAGTFTYSPKGGTVLSPGQQKLNVTFTPTNTTDYTTATESVTLTVDKLTPSITWGTPKAITYGTALSATQLDATSTVAGTFAYSPAAGTVLSVGQQTLTATFTPTNTTDYATATASVTLTVNPAPSFTLGASSSSLAVAQGASGKTTITVTGKNGFAGSVTLTASGLPSGISAVFGTNPTTGASVLTLTASSTASAGTATVTIKGTSGNLTASTTIALTVSCTPTTIVPYIYLNGAWTEEASVTVSSPSTVVDLGPQPSTGGSWKWTGPSGYTSTARQINSIPLTVGTDSYLATYTNAGGCKSTETFTITVK